MIEEFGQMPGGKPVPRVTLRGGGLVARFLGWGAVLQDLRLDGHAAPLVLGFDDFAHYLSDSPYFGATVGRCANRIRDGHLELDGRTHRLDRNEAGRHTLHGGAGGSGRQLWQIADHGADFVEMRLVLPDGHMGFPGALRIEARFALPGDGVLDIRLRAETDAPTLCNLAHHSYFNLDGGGHVLDHRLRLAGDAYLPVDTGLIPTGEIRAVDGTEFDFRAGAPVGQAGGLDHNFCLSEARLPPRPVAWLDSPVSGVSLECRTTEPGLQVYDGGGIDVAHPGLDGLPMGAHAGLALEPQVWPDAHHHPGFPQAVLRPGETYAQHTQFRFAR